MADRRTLSLSNLEDFKLWLTNIDGWSLEQSKGEYEVLRARKASKKRPLIVWKRLSDRNGDTLTHLTVDDRDIGIIIAYQKWRAENG